MTPIRFVSRSLRSLAWLVAATFALPALADTVIVQPGPEGKSVNIASGQLANTNLSFAPQWLISAWSPGPEGRPRSIGLLEFDLSALSGYSVQSAQLVLYQNDNFDPNATYSVFRITSAWDESTVTFNTAPSIDGTPVASITLPASDIDGGPGGAPVRSAFRYWEITSTVQEWLSGASTNHGLWVERTAQDPNDDRPSVYFAGAGWPTEEGGFPPGVFGTQYRPALLVEASAVPLPAAGWLLLSGLAGVGLLRRTRLSEADVRTA